jgi:2-polyprenyl-3-methyl-5-hydroxy-6-metoxy-1,4-benzoquinol methylase
MSEYLDLRTEGDVETQPHKYLYIPLQSLLTDHYKTIILDLGCGIGSLTKQLIKDGYNVYGTDASAKGIEIAQRDYPDRFAIQNLETDDLPQQFNHLRFNTIISTEVIEHLYNPRRFIQFSKKVLTGNGGGNLIISTPYHGYLKNVVIGIAGIWDTHMNPLWDGGHIKMWSRKTLTMLLEEEGFEVTDFKGCGRFPYFWKSMMIKGRLIS